MDRRIPLDWYLYGVEPEIEGEIMIEPEQIKEMRNAFNLFVSDQATQTIRPSQLLAIFRRIHLDQSHTSVAQMLEHITTTTHDAEMQFETFMRHMNEYYSERNSSQGIQRIFRLFDNNGQGLLTK